MNVCDESFVLFVKVEDIRVKLVDIDVFGCCLEQDSETFACDRDGGAHDYYREEEGAKWIEVPELREEVDHCSGSDHA